MNLYLKLIPVILLALTVIAGLAIFLRYREIWQQGQTVRAGLSFRMIMRLDRQGVPVRTLLDSYIRTRQSRMQIPFDCYLELHQRGGNSTRVSMAMVLAKSSGLDLSFKDLCDIELHRMDAFNYVDQQIQAQKESTKGRFPRR